MKIDINEYQVSVILTLFNSKNFYRRAVESLFNQIYKDFELIIVDDGSIDYTESDLFPFLKENQNVKYIRHSNRKHPLSLNTGLKCSSGKYITFLDSDDEYEPEHLQERINFLSEHPETDFIHSPVNVIGNEEDHYVPDADDLTRMIHLDECLIGGTFFGKRNVFEELGGFRNVYSHDYDFYKRILAAGKYNISKLDSRTYIYYRSNPGSITKSLIEI